MIKKFLQNILQKPESSRNNWALGLSIFLSIIIFFGWSVFNGYVSLGGGQKPASFEEEQVAAVAASSPIENTGKSFLGIVEEVKTQYKNFQESMLNVLIPFMSSIEVYEKK